MIILNTRTGTVQHIGDERRDLMELHLQRYIESNLKSIFGLKYLASECVIQSKNGVGRIDTLALTPNNELVIIEYKKKNSKKAIVQALQYLDGLKDSYMNIPAIGLLDKPICMTNIHIICIARKFTEEDIVLARNLKKPIHLFTYSFHYPEHIALHLEMSNHNVPFQPGILMRDNILYDFINAVITHSSNQNVNAKDKINNSRGKDIFIFQPLSKASGYYGLRLEKKPACVWGRKLLLIKVGALHQILNRSEWSLNAIYTALDEEYKVTLQDSESTDNLVLAPKQYRTQYGCYTALHLDKVLQLFPQHGDYLLGIDT